MIILNCSINLSAERKIYTCTCTWLKHDFSFFVCLVLRGSFPISCWEIRISHLKHGCACSFRNPSSRLPCSVVLSMTLCSYKRTDFLIVSYHGYRQLYPRKFCDTMEHKQREYLGRKEDETNEFYCWSCFTIHYWEIYNVLKNRNHLNLSNNCKQNVWKYLSWKNSKESGNYSVTSI